MPRIACHTPRTLTFPEALSIVRLIHDAWPSPSPDFQAGAAALVAETAPPAPAWRHVIWEGVLAVAHAAAFRRRILTPAGPLDVLAIGGVCVLRDRRGTGLGKEVFLAAVARVDRDVDPPVALFQTSIPTFYERLGARQVRNRFVNRLNAANPDAVPWWDPCPMIYPAAFPWPEGEINLNGPAY